MSFPKLRLAAYQLKASNFCFSYPWNWNHFEAGQLRCMSNWALRFDLETIHLIPLPINLHLLLNSLTFMASSTLFALTYRTCGCLSSLMTFSPQFTDNWRITSWFNTMCLERENQRLVLNSVNLGIPATCILETSFIALSLLTTLSFLFSFTADN